MASSQSSRRPLLFSSGFGRGGSVSRSSDMALLPFHVNVFLRCLRVSVDHSLQTFIATGVYRVGARIEIHTEVAGTVSFETDCLPFSSPRSERHIRDRKSTRLNSSHQIISYAVFC